MVREWPGARGGPAGRYFWDMGGSKWMHHGLMTLRMGTFADPETGSATAVTVAGYPATYPEERDSSDAVLSRTWIVDIEGRRVFIIVLHGVGAADGGALTAAQVEEADAIVESMRHETSPDGTGSRLTFTLPVGWDSG